MPIFKAKNENLKIAAITATFLLLVFSYFLLYINAQKLDEQGRSVDKSHKFFTELTSVRIINNELEYYYNGYIISEKTLFKEKFYKIESKANNLFSDLQKEVGSSPIQSALLDTLEINLQSKIERLKLGFSILDKSPMVNASLQDSLLTATYNAKFAGQIRDVITQMEDNEEKQGIEKGEKVIRFSKDIKLITLISLLIAFVLATVALILYRKNSVERMKAIDESDKYKQQLERKIDDLRNANIKIKELRRMEKFASTGRIARTIAHEVRNPLTNINLAAEQIKENDGKNIEEKNMLLGMISRNSKRINELISNLLNATKFLELSQKEISLNQIINEALALAKDRIELKKVTVVKDLDPEICEIKLDQDKMKIAFLNLIVNAVEAMSDKEGVLTITTEEKDKYCHISFTDNGSGMGEEMLDRLFEPYFTSKENGHGLGLTNTQNIILNHEGKIDVYSKLGEGTTVVVQLNF